LASFVCGFVFSVFLGEQVERDEQIQVGVCLCKAQAVFVHDVCLASGCKTVLHYASDDLVSGAVHFSHLFMFPHNRQIYSPFPL